MANKTCDHCEGIERVRQFERAKNGYIVYENICFECATYIVEMNKKMQLWVGE
jgi:hypothetical protein